MRILLFTVLNCIACDAHRKQVIELCRNCYVSLNIYDIDDPRYLTTSLAAMRKWNIQKTPSIVVLDECGNLVGTIQGINHSLEKLGKIIHEKRQEECGLKRSGL